MAVLELGIDEAGRGPILGPLVIAGVVVPEDKQERLMEWGIHDSKRYGSGALARRKRECLSKKIRGAFRYKIKVLSSDVVDDYVMKKSLNILEQETASEIIETLPAHRVVLDGKNLFKPLENDTTIARDKADTHFLSVSAASILAKATRDRLFEDFRQQYKGTFGELRGGGYANQNTLTFVKWHLRETGELPPGFRQSFKWKHLEACRTVDN